MKTSIAEPPPKPASEVTFSAEEIYEASQLLAASRPLAPVDALVVHARSFDGDDDGMLELVRELVPSLSPVAVINGGDGSSFHNRNEAAWPGALDYEKRLNALGVSSILHSSEGQHTRDECIKFVDMMVEHHWTRVIVVNLIQFQLRGMLGMTSELEKRGILSRIKLFPASPTAVNWRTNVRGTQGKGNLERVITCRSELDQVRKHMTVYPHNFTVPLSGLIRYLVSLNAD